MQLSLGILSHAHKTLLLESEKRDTKKVNNKEKNNETKQNKQKLNEKTKPNVQHVNNGKPYQESLYFNIKRELHALSDVLQRFNTVLKVRACISERRNL